MPFLGVEPVQEFASVAKQTITGTGATAYSLDHSVSSANDLAVFVNNVRQEPTSAYTASGGTITFTSALASTDSCYVMYIARTFSSATAEANSVGITELNVSDGTSGQALTTDGSGTLSFSTVSSATPTLDAVTGAGATTTNAITVGTFTSTGIDDNATATRLTVNNGFTEFDATNHYIKLNGSTDTTDIGTSSNNFGYSYVVNNSPTGNNGIALYDSGAVEIWSSADNVITGSLRIDTSGNTTVNNFTSTGIDDNATSTAVTIDSSQNTTFAGNLTAGDGTNISMGST